MALDMPFGVRPVAEKITSPDAIALRRRALALELDRSFEDHDGLVDIVVLVEPALGAGPDQGHGSAVRAGRQHERKLAAGIVTDEQMPPRRSLADIGIEIPK